MDDLISRNALLREIMGRPPEAHYPDYYAAIVQQIPAVCSCDVLKETPSYETIEIEVMKKMEQIFTFNAKITMRFSGLEEGYESTDSINQFKKELKPWMEGVLRAGVLHMDDVKVSDVKVFQLE